MVLPRFVKVVSSSFRLQRCLGVKYFSLGVADLDIGTLYSTVDVPILGSLYYGLFKDLQ